MMNLPLTMAIESGSVLVYRDGFSFNLAFLGWLDSCDCPTCAEQKAAFEFLSRYAQDIKQEVQS